MSLQTRGNLIKLRTYVLKSLQNKLNYYFIVIQGVRKKSRNGSAPENSFPSKNDLSFPPF